MRNNTTTPRSTELFKTGVVDKATGEFVVIEGRYASKAAFIRELRSNGYRVTEYKVKPADVYDWIVDHTNCNEWDWTETNEVPR